MTGYCPFQFTAHAFCCTITSSMALAIELAAFTVVFLSYIEACSYNSDCFNENTSDFQCCNGQCIDKHSHCYSIVPVLSLTFFAMGVVLICIIGCYCCYPFCPGFRQYRTRSMSTYIIEGQPVYQQFTSDPSAADMAEPSSGLFYPQFVRFQHGYPIHQPNHDHPYPLRQPGDHGWHGATDMGQHAAPPYTEFAD